MREARLGLTVGRRDGRPGGRRGHARSVRRGDRRRNADAPPPHDPATRTTPAAPTTRRHSRHRCRRSGAAGAAHAGRIEPVGVLTVEVVTAGSSAEAAVGAVGGDVVRELDGLALVTVPARQVDRLAVQPGVSQVRLPTDMREVMARSLPPRAEVGPDAVSQFGSRMIPSSAPVQGGIGQRIGIIGLFDTTVLAQQVACRRAAPIPAGRTHVHQRRRRLSVRYARRRLRQRAGRGRHRQRAVRRPLPRGARRRHRLPRGDRLDGRAAASPPCCTTGRPRTTAQETVPASAASVIDYAVSKGILWVNAAGELGSDPQYTHVRRSALAGHVVRRRQRPLVELQR